MITTVIYPFSDSVVLVTGAGTGIGRSVARAFLEQGARVAVTGRSATSLHEAVSGFPAEQALVHPTDLAQDGAPAGAVAAAAARFGKLDAVVASAGTSEPSRIGDLSSWERLRRINLDAMVALADASVPHLRRTRGSFLAISSIAGLRGDWGMFGYNATKAAVNALMQSLALDLGADGVRVNALAPGFTRSRLTEERLSDDDFYDRLMDRTALRRVADPEDIARAALFLCSPDASYITGAIIPVDGGVSASSGTPRG
ncbi:SDR family NAD(P)-dependent oxidoreductase [Gordonia insulae]|uniref:Gluconate 5-dehydrogenase n=1 Tax=Gordonia insulae TaxID=2420509 RepID=A0A3G8JQY7_9ACTN|nr:SDR family oxidoreductase [Gordonia insulae]AZG47541.1 Gluconate 5-dehydrogenase [Gordonia insulae]